VACYALPEQWFHRQDEQALTPSHAPYAPLDATMMTDNAFIRAQFHLEHAPWTALLLHWTV
jgi:hypothetical protein